MSETTLSRRGVLLGGTLAGAAALSTVAGLPAAALTGAGVARRDEVFTLGVASGDPAPDGVVLWTRLAANPLAEDGMGGMPNRTFPVSGSRASCSAASRRPHRSWATASTSS